MKNDYDFIKEKIESSGVNAPDNMDGAYVLEKLGGVQPKVIAMKPKRKIGRIAAIAAAVVAVAAIGTAVTVHLAGQKADVPPVSESTGLVRFENYDQVRGALKEISARSRGSAYDEEAGADYAVNDANGMVKAGSVEYSGLSATTTQSSGSATGSGSHSETYKQVDNVDEADVIKTDGRYIYAVERSYSLDDYTDTSCVCIFPAIPGTTDPILRLIPGESYEAASDEATPDEATSDEEAPEEPYDIDDGYEYSSSYISDIFVKDSRLIILCSDYHEHYYQYESFTRAYVYDVEDIDRVTLLDTFSQSGGYTSSRMIGDTLYLISNEYSATDIPLCGRGYEPNKIAADCIYSIENPSQDTFLIVSAYDTLDYTADADSKAILGIADTIYCNEENLYITAMTWNYSVYYADDTVEADRTFVSYSPSTCTTKIFKVNLTDGVSFVAYGEVEGYLNNQYSLDEHNGYLRVASTTTNDDYENVNNLYVLDGSLNQVGAVTGFAETESIKAVRYVGDTAYVITYEQTDPLFVIDLSSPSSPTILGEVKISGFSTMLVPIDDSTILGIGYNTGEADYTDMEVTDGLKLALFDVSDKTNPQVLDSKSYVNYSSEVMYNAKALVYNPDRNDFVIPMNYYYYSGDDDDYDDSNWSGDDWEHWYEKNTVQFGGALNFRVEGGRIIETDLVRTDYSNISRCVYVDGEIYMLAPDDSGILSLTGVSYR